MSDDPGLRAADLAVKNAPSGAPFVEQAGAPWPGCLSISHREPYGVAAYESEAGRTLGIDLELVVERDMALVRTFFTETEQREVRKLAGRARHLAVARIWSAKEAVLKALRIGLRHDTRELEIALSPGGVAGGLPPGFEALTLRTSSGLRARFEGNLELGWREEDDHVLTLASVGPPSIDGVGGAT